MNPLAISDFVFAFVQDISIILGLLAVILSALIYIFLTDRYAEALFGVVFTVSSVSLLIGILFFPTQFTGSVILVYSSVFFIPYFLSNLTLRYVSSSGSDWVVLHSYAFYGWFSSTLLYNVTESSSASLGGATLSGVSTAVPSSLTLTLMSVLFTVFIYRLFIKVRENISKLRLRPVLNRILAKIKIS